MRAVAGSAGEEPAARRNPTFDEANDVRVARGNSPRIECAFTSTPRNAPRHPPGCSGTPKSVTLARSAGKCQFCWHQGVPWLELFDPAAGGGRTIHPRALAMAASTASSGLIAGRCRAH
jgi:hypothetical protein